MWWGDGKGKMGAREVGGREKFAREKLGVEDGVIPVFPDGIEALGAKHFCDACGVAFVADFELFGGALAALFLLEFDAFAADGEVDVVVTRAGVAAGFGACASGEVGGAEGGEAVAEVCGFAGGEDDADVGEGEAEGGDELEEGAVLEEEIVGGLVLVISRVGSHAREGDGVLRFPAVLGEIFEVGGEGEGFLLPRGEAEEGTDADATEAAVVGAFGAVEAPEEVFLGASGVEFLINFGDVGFLVHDDAFGAVLDDFAVLVVFHRSDFDGEGGNERFEGVDAGLEVAVGDEFRVLAGDEENVAEALLMEKLCLADDLLDGEGGAEDGIVA